MALTKLQETAITFMVANPFMKDAQVCKKINVNPTTMSRWNHQQEFKEALHQACKDKFEAAEKIAIEGLIKNAEKGNVQAQKYLLDYMDYKAPDKVEQTVTVIDVTVDDDDDK